MDGWMLEVGTLQARLSSCKGGKLLWHMTRACRAQQLKIIYLQHVGE